MKILFLVYHGFSQHSGITKKIHYQVKGLRANGHQVYLCYYGFAANGHRCRYVDEAVIADFGTGLKAGIRQRIDYSDIYGFCRSHGVEMVYARSFQNATPWLVGLFRRLNRLGIVSVTEVPTYPYDQEFATFPFSIRMKLKVDQLFRHSLSRQMSAIVTFSDADTIFGQRTIRISNGVDLDSIPLHIPPSGSGVGTPLHLIGVAEVHIWHGYDRLIAGLGEYYRKTVASRPVFFHVVGGVHTHDMDIGTKFYPAFRDMLRRDAIEDKVIFHGTLFGRELDEVFNQCHFAIGSLARHRSGVTVIKTLKNREYASRGLPFVYSENDSDFDGQPYVLKVPADETPIDIQQIIDFVDTHHFEPEVIRSTVEHLDWKIQMKQVVDQAIPQPDVISRKPVSSQQ